MNNQIDVVAFGPLYLDFLMIPNGRVNLLYGRERLLSDYELTRGGFVLHDLYDDRNLQLITSGDVERGTSSLQVDDEETECSYRTSIGGSTTNFAVQLRRLGLNTFLIGKVGVDRYGNRLRTLLRDMCEYSLLKSNAKQTLGINILDPETKEVAMMVSGSSNTELNAQEIDEMLQRIITADQFLYAGGFFKMRQLFPYYSEIFRRAQELGCKVVLDHGRFLGRRGSQEYQETLRTVRDALQYVYAYLQNDSEITELTGNSDLQYSLREAQELGPQLVVCKTGANGCSFVTSKDSEIYHVPQEHKPREIVHTAGAGDSFNAGLIKGLREDSEDIENAARLGNATAYLKITRGTYPTYSDVAQLLI